jgi:hypothetical protein
MRFRQPYSLPELFALLSAYPAYLSPGAWGVGPQQTSLHQVIRLAREGMREYGHRLDVLEQQVSQHSWERDQTDPAQGLQQRSEDAISECDSSYRERGRRDAEPSQLNERQIHHLFNELAIQRRLLNGRGFPYTVDVNEEQRRIYPGSELLTMYEVEAAWDDWKNEDGKQLFRRARCADTEERQQAEPSRNEPSEYPPERGISPKQEPVDAVLRTLSQEHFDAIFYILRNKSGTIEEWGRPRDFEVHELQRRLFDQFAAATRAEIERAYSVWALAQAQARTVRTDIDIPPADWPNPARRHQEQGEERPRQRRRRFSREQVFLVFDEFLSDSGRPVAELAEDNFPRLSDVNRLLFERGEAQLEEESALRCEWMEYLIVTARKRSGNKHNRGSGPDSSNANRAYDPRAFRNQPSPVSVEGESDISVFEDKTIEKRF